MEHEVRPMPLNRRARFARQGGPAFQVLGRPKKRMWKLEENKSHKAYVAAVNLLWCKNTMCLLTSTVQLHMRAVAIRDLWRYICAQRSVRSEFRSTGCEPSGGAEFRRSTLSRMRRTSHCQSASYAAHGAECCRTTRAYSSLASGVYCSGGRPQRCIVFGGE